MNTGRGVRRRAVGTAGMIQRVPNQPKTPIRGMRVPDELWAAAKRVAAERGEDVSTVLRAALARYVKRHEKDERGKP